MWSSDRLAVCALFGRRLCVNETFVSCLVCMRQTALW